MFAYWMVVSFSHPFFGRKTIEVPQSHSWWVAIPTLIEFVSAKIYRKPRFAPIFEWESTIIE